ncbi:hypothetical protein [Subtercola boreus]|uniref:Uncharacterized protein n=1 Tax=Subtercola boreus TaxID=120213 RepID=A0A3E0W9V4_9MICO|nr:hypothetical protein [Subtercola boreus]RFA20558.1 hypothetical protein B7R24_08990 [Subtercola boreus]RFA20673.1 hypothetical protein B7R23_08925 [Subtercola boreus]RFA26883.1 hypothetical protein B7R25_09055 [Subtercola boreus]
MALLAAAAVAVVATVAMMAPTLGTSPVVALDSNTALNQGGAAPEVPMLAPGTMGDGSVGDGSVGDGSVGDGSVGNAPIAGSAAVGATAVQVAAARTFAGSQLASNAGLTLSANARELLVAGQVDARGILSLGQYLGQTRLTVADFPAADAGTGTAEVRRRILVSGLAGVPLGTDATVPGSTAPGSAASAGAAASAAAAAAASVEAWFQGLSAPVEVESVARVPAGVLVTFAPGEPSSLLPSPAPAS